MVPLGSRVMFWLAAAVFAFAAPGTVLAQLSKVDLDTLRQVGVSLESGLPCAGARPDSVHVADVDAQQDVGDAQPDASDNASSGDDRIRAAQHRLNRLGYRAGREDGKSGPVTRAAISRFQEDEGLPVTGRLDRNTAVLLELAEKGAVVRPSPDGWATAQDPWRSSSTGSSYFFFRHR